MENGQDHCCGDILHWFSLYTDGAHDMGLDDREYGYCHSCYYSFFSLCLDYWFCPAPFIVFSLVEVRSRDCSSAGDLETRLKPFLRPSHGLVDDRLLLITLNEELQ